MRVGIIISILILSGCSSIGPRVPTDPGPGKTPIAFEEDQAACVAYADHEAGPAVQNYNARQSAVMAGSVTAGLLIGHAVHDELGGMAAGAIAPVAQAGTELELLRRTYDVYFAQCMYAHGDRVHV